MQCVRWCALCGHLQPARRPAAHLVVSDHEDAHLWPLRLEAVDRLGHIPQSVNVQACAWSRGIGGVGRQEETLQMNETLPGQARCAGKRSSWRGCSRVVCRQRSGQATPPTTHQSRFHLVWPCQPPGRPAAGSHSASSRRLHHTHPPDSSSACWAGAIEGGALACCKAVAASGPVPASALCRCLCPCCCRKGTGAGG